MNITKAEAESLQEFIEMNFFDNIRNDPDADNMEWAFNICVLWKRCKDCCKKEGSNT